MTKHRYTEQQLRKAVANTRSIRQTLQNLNIAAKGGNYRVIHKAIAMYNIDISHFTQQSWSKGLVIGPKRLISDYLDGGIPISSYRLKLRLIKEQILEQRCSNCSLTTWLEKPIPSKLSSGLPFYRFPRI